MTTQLFSVVDEHVARNPIARALARQAMRTSVRDITLAWYVPTPYCDPGDVAACKRALDVALAVLDVLKRTDTEQARVMSQARAVLYQVVERGYRWRIQDAPAIDIGLQHALDVLRDSDAKTQQRAWQMVTEDA